jgi:CMP-N-acetylneuraminic acid synthetase
MSVLAIIPARGGSKGVPRKNLRQVGGKSLLVRAVEAARECSLIDNVLVTTEDEEIAREAASAGAEVPFLRPAELAGDTISTIPVLVHAVSAYEEATGRRPTVLLLIEATVPFRRSELLTAAIERYRKGDCRSVISVCPLERKPQNIFVKAGSGHLQPYIMSPLETFTRRQDMEHLCRLSSGVYVVGCDDFLAARSLVQEPTGYVEMSARESINIDDELDLMVADLVAETYRI